MIENTAISMHELCTDRVELQNGILEVCEQKLFQKQPGRDDEGLCVALSYISLFIFQRTFLNNLTAAPETRLQGDRNIHTHY